MNRIVITLYMLLVLPVSTLAIETDDVRHLLSRTGFTVTRNDMQSLQAQDYTQAVDTLLKQTRTTAVTSPPDWVNDPPPDFRALRKAGKEEKKAFRKKKRQQAMELKSWWYTEMLTTPSQLTEIMTLFWHNHFTSSTRKVKWPTLMYRQNVLLRQHALGSFREMLHAIARDPAMVLYLDNQTNRAGQPNENFARELLELFTLGEGHYTEQDIKEAARAFTGWKMSRKTGKFRFNARQHDNGVKVFLGQSGNFDGDDILDILLAQPRTAEYISSRIWSAFITTPADPATLSELAKVFRTNDYQIKSLLRAILTSEAFLSQTNRGTDIKSPVVFLVGTARFLELPVQDKRILVRGGRALGQDIFDPPNVKGWSGGTSWINASTLLLRQQIISRLLRGKEMGKKNMSMVAMRDGILPDDLQHTSAVELSRLMLPIPPIQPLPDNASAEVAIEQLLQDPAYQLR